MEDGEVRAKARAAVAWCEHATTHELKHGGKPWSYLLIPHDAIDELASEDFTPHTWGPTPPGRDALRTATKRAGSGVSTCTVSQRVFQRAIAAFPAAAAAFGDW